jgi:hypothetical protein
LRKRGRDVILLGFDDRSASILENAEVATACIMRTSAERLGNAGLVVGGCGTGGLITRYALARMEEQRMAHQTADTPHYGAWIPSSLQAFAHFLTRAPALSQQINSPVMRQILGRHLETVDGTPREDPLRTELLDTLNKMGGWPQLPRNGSPIEPYAARSSLAYRAARCHLQWQPARHGTPPLAATDVEC